MSPDDREREVLDLVLTQTRRFLAREVDAAALESGGRMPAALVAAAAEAGLFGLTIPEAHGGLGLSLGAACRVVAELATVDRAVAIMVGLHCGLGTRGLVAHGDAAQHARWLPALASGERVAAFAATEAGAGSDLAALRTTLRLDGDALVLDGEKSYVTNGGFAGLFTVLARSPGLGGARATALVCVPRETPGLVVGPEEHKLGIRASSTVTVTFDGARVPLGHVLGAPGRGMDLAHAVLAWGRTLMAAGCIGTARAALDATLAHVTTRRQFHRPIGDFAATRAHVTTMAARVLAMEALVDDVAARERAGAALDAASAAAKVFCSEGAFEVCDAAVQLHGALGFLEPVGVARMLRDCRVTRIFEGANDVLLVRAGAAMLASPDGANGGAPPPLVVGGPLRDAARGLETLTSRLRQATAAVRAEHGVAGVGHQLVLQRLARADLCARAASAVLRRVARDDERAALGAWAAEHLADEGARLLDGLGRAVADETAAEAVSERLYAPWRAREVVR